MTGKEKTILAAIKTALGNLTEFKYVGEYPLNVQLIGDKYPAVLVEDGDEVNDEANSLTDELLIRWDIRTHIYIRNNQTTITELLDLQTKVINAVTRITGSGADCIYYISVEKGGEESGYSDYLQAGYQDPTANRTINFEVVFRDQR